MKRVWMIVAACLLLAVLAGCAPAAPAPAQTPETPQPAGQEQPETPAQPEQPEQPAEPEQPEEPVQQPEPEQAEPPAEQPDAANAGPTVDDALAFTDQDVSALVAAIGEPLSTSYEASCMGDGDDGIWQYDGFVVFTYREKDGSAETVIDAE